VEGGVEGSEEEESGRRKTTWRRVQRSREEADDDELTLFSLCLFPLFSLFFCPSFPLSLCSSMSHHSFPLQLALSPSSSRPLVRRPLQRRLLHPRLFSLFFEHKCGAGRSIRRRQIGRRALSRLASVPTRTGWQALLVPRQRSTLHRHRRRSRATREEERPCEQSPQINSSRLSPSSRKQDESRSYESGNEGRYRMWKEEGRQRRERSMLLRREKEDRAKVTRRNGPSRTAGGKRGQ
jgi:hypothetical protein